MLACAGFHQPPALLSDACGMLPIIVFLSILPRSSAVARVGPGTAKHLAIVPPFYRRRPELSRFFADLPPGARQTPSRFPCRTISSQMSSISSCSCGVQEAVIRASFSAKERLASVGASL